MSYLEETRVELHYELPLAEIIYDFFDALKSRTKGYASFDYEFKEYRESKLVKLDFLLNGEIVDALSFIVFADSAYPRARRSPKTSRKTSPASCSRCRSRRPSAARLSPGRRSRPSGRTSSPNAYGGDITRKKKLLEKQKEGKKRMRKLGSVEVPQRRLWPS